LLQLISVAALIFSLIHTKKQIKENIRYVTWPAEITYMIMAAIGVVLFCLHRGAFIYHYGMSLGIFVKQILSSAIRVQYLLDLMILSLSTMIYLKAKNKGISASLPVIFFGEFLFSSTAITDYFLTSNPQSSKKMRGKKDYFLVKIYFIIAVFTSIVCFYFFRHVLVHHTLFEVDLTTDSMGTIGSSIIAIDLYFLGSIVSIFTAVDSAKSGFKSLWIFWLWIYLILGIALGAAIFNTVFYMHYEYLFQKYEDNKSSSWNDEFLFLLINGLLVLLCALVMNFTPMSMLLFPQFM